MSTTTTTTTTTTTIATTATTNIEIPLGMVKKNLLPDSFESVNEDIFKDRTIKSYIRAGNFTTDLNTMKGESNLNRNLVVGVDRTRNSTVSVVGFFHYVSCMNGWGSMFV